MAAWYEAILANLVSNIQSIILAAVSAFLTWIAFRELGSLFKKLKARQKLPPLLVDYLESMVRQMIGFVGTVVFLLNASVPLGLYDIVAAATPALIVAGITFVVTWFLIQAVKVLFSLLREKKAFPIEVIGPLEIVAKYSVIAIGTVLIILDIAAGLGYAEAISSLTLGWLVANTGGITFIVIVVVGTRILVRFLRVFFEDLRKRTSLHPQIVDMASVTVRYLTYTVAAIILFATFFRILGMPELSPTLTSLLAVVIGLAVSFAGAGAIGNLISGLILMNWKPYQVGDRVELGGGAYGDIDSFDVMFTKVITPTKERIYVPNALVLANRVTNYSPRCIVHPRVNVRYDVDRRTVEELLVKAAVMTEILLDEPKPSVYVRSLSNFYVEYELRAYTDQPNRLLEAYSSLQKNILDIFDEARVELLSPQYSIDSPFFLGTGGRKVRE